MFLILRILVHATNNLIDGGTSCSFSGSQSLNMFETLGVEPKSRHGLVKIANSRLDLVTLEITAEIKLKNKIKKFYMRVLSLPFDLRFRLNFLRNFGIIADYKDCKWSQFMTEKTTVPAQILLKAFKN